MGSPVCSVLLLSMLPMFCACMLNEPAVREIYDIIQRNSQGFSTAADRMAAVTVVPNILLIPSVYTAQTSARKLSCILRLQLNFRAMQSRSESRHLDRIACDCVLYLSMI